MNIRKFKDVIAKRECTNDEAYWDVEKCWQDLVEVLCEDMPGTIKYLYSGCTAREFALLSEVLDETVAHIPDMDFIKALRYLAKKYPEENSMCQITPFIDSAQCLIEAIEAQNWPLVKDVVPEASVPSLKAWLRSHGKLKKKEQ
jgi:hypothetical protein